MRKSVSLSTIRRRVADGTLPVERIGRLVRINPRTADLVFGGAA